MQDQYSFNRGAVRPIQCLSDGWVMLKGQYGAFLGVLIVGGLVMLVSACIPLSPLMPPVICGLYLCMFAIMNRQPFNTSTLFKGFDFFGPSFLASLVTTIPIFVLSFVMQLGMGGISAAIDSLKLEQNPDPEKVLPVLFGVFGFIFGIYLLIILVALVLGTLMAFVYPLIVDRRLAALDAVKLSFRAVMGNFFGVFGLMIVGQLLILAGLMFFYFGALFVAPVVFAAWAIAYRRVFPLRVTQTSMMGAQQQIEWTPPVTNSKAGWVLTLGSLAVIGLAVTAFAGIGYFAYQGIAAAIEKAQAEQAKRESLKDTPYTYPTPPPYPTPNTRNPTGGKTISGGILNGKAIHLPAPVYPPAAKAVKARGTVIVQVEVDETGAVISAKALSGHPLLRASAEQAARSAKFKPTVLNGKAQKVSGLLTYNFNE